MNILIAGGTGFIGKRLSHILIKNGYRVFILTRNINKKNIIKNATFVDWETINPELLSSVKVVIKLSGENVAQLWTRSAKKRILNSRVEITSKLFDFCKNNEIVPNQLINASAVGIYGRKDAKYSNESVDENSKIGDSFLADVCQKNEQSCEVFNIFDNISILQIRIGVVLTRKFTFLLALPTIFSIPNPGNKNYYFPWIHLDDVVGFIYYSIENKFDGIYNVIGKNLTNHKDFYQILAKNYFGFFPWTLFLPISLIKSLGDMSEMLLYGPKTSSEKISASGYNFQHENLKSALKKLP